MSYAPPRGSADEAVGLDGTLRPHYAPLLRTLARRDLRALAAELDADARRSEVLHGDHVLHFDPVPRMLAADEWATLAAGLEQRVRALEAFVADAYGERRAVAAGVIGADVLETSRYLEPDVPPAGIDVAGPDVIRHPDGDLVVLEDNVRTPTLMAYAAWAREALAPLLRGDGMPAPRPFAEPLVGRLDGLLRGGDPEVRVFVLTDGTDDMLGWEAAWLADALGAAVGGLDALAPRGDRLVERDTGEPVDVVYRRTSEERLRTDDGRLNALGEVLLGPLRAGTLRVVNPFGTGIADDKRTYAYVEALISFFLSEAPLVRSVPTLDLGVPEAREEALDRLDELVFKPRTGSGGHGLVVGPRASGEERRELTEAVRREPGEWVAQDTLHFSTHPTVVDGALEPRHVDLRAFVIDGTAIPGGLSRVALEAGNLIVNCSQGGGGKDTWILEG